MNIHWEEKAESDAIAILEYIAKDNISAAYETYEVIKQQVNRLLDYPKLGRVGRVKGIRELVISGTPYITAYSIKGDDIYILRILHGAQDWKKQFTK